MSMCRFSVSISSAHSSEGDVLSTLVCIPNVQSMYRNVTVQKCHCTKMSLYRMSLYRNVTVQNVTVCIIECDSTLYVGMTS